MPTLRENQSKVSELARQRGLDLNQRIHHDDPSSPRLRDLATGNYPEYEKTIKTWLRLLEVGPH